MQIYAMPVFDMIETVLVKKLHFKPTGALRFVARTVYVGKYDTRSLVARSYIPV